MAAVAAGPWPVVKWEEGKCFRVWKMKRKGECAK